MTPMDAPAPPTPRRIIRSSSDRIIAGVASGFGRYFNVDPVLIRLGFVLLTFLGGIGALLYLVAWLIIPEEVPTAGAEPEPTRRIAPGWVLVLGLLVVAAFGGIGRIGFGIRSDVVWPITLIVIGVAVLWTRRRSPGDEPVSESGPEVPAPGREHQPPPALASPSPAGRSETDRAGGTWPEPTITPSPFRRALPVLVRVALAVFGAIAMLVVALLAVVVLESVGDVRITFLEALFAALVAIAIAIWAGRRWHRTLDLLLIATAMIVVLAFAAWLRPPLHGGFGTRDLRPADASAIDHSYELGAGRLRLDLSRVNFAGHHRALAASLGIGRLDVIVPDDTTVVFAGHVRGGEICSFGLRDAGTDISRHVTSGHRGGVLRVRAQLGVGSLRIARNSQRGAKVCGWHRGR